MQYRKISIEFIIFPEQEQAVVAELNSTLDALDEKYNIFGGEVEGFLSSTAGVEGKLR